jgi:hypothetical protein
MMIDIASFRVFFMKIKELRTLWAIRAHLSMAYMMKGGLALIYHNID